MSCILRAYGTDFDVDSFLNSSHIEAVSVIRKGTPRFPASQPDGPKNNRSGIHFEASSADFDEIERQIEEATAFVIKESDFIQNLKGFPGVEKVILDFGAEIDLSSFLMSVQLPIELLLACGKAGIPIEVSIYPKGSEDE